MQTFFIDTSAEATNVIEDRFWNYVNDDCKYLISIQKINSERSIESFRAEYFSLVDLVVSETGYTKTSVHSDIKKKLEVETTKDFSEDEWQIFLFNFKQYIFNNLDILI